MLTESRSRFGDVRGMVPVGAGSAVYGVQSIMNAPRVAADWRRKRKAAGDGSRYKRRAAWEEITAGFTADV